MPTATIPPDKDARDIFWDRDILKEAKDLADEHPGALAMSITATFNEQFNIVTQRSFHTAPGYDFVGQSWVYSPATRPHDLAIVCLLDYEQIPCAPEKPLVTIVAQEEYTSSIHLPTLTSGLHDFGLLVVQDPYQGIDGDLSKRSETGSLLSIANVYSNQSAISPTLTPLSVPHKPGLKDYSSLFYVSKVPELLEPNGLIRVWLSEERQPGEMVDFFLHFNWQEDRHETNIAMMAFIDYQQVPIYNDDVSYLPLYIDRETRSWQTLPVQIRVPDEPGVYELFFVAVSHPFEPQVINGEYVSDLHVEDSQRIRLDVIP